MNATIEQSDLDYGFDKRGGFYVIDHAKRRAAYAYYSSPHADKARKSPFAVACAMASEFDSLPPGLTKDIAERNYFSIRESARGGDGPALAKRLANQP